MLHPIKVVKIDVFLKDDGQNRRKEDTLDPAIRISSFLNLDPVSCVFLRNSAIIDGEAKKFFTLLRFFFFF